MQKLIAATADLMRANGKQHGHSQAAGATAERQQSYGQVKSLPQHGCKIQLLSCPMQVKPEELASKVTSLQGDLKAANKEIEALRTQLTLAKSEVCVCVCVCIAVRGTEVMKGHDETGGGGCGVHSLLCQRQRGVQCCSDAIKSWMVSSRQESS
jgi:hypothetical protein